MSITEPALQTLPRDNKIVRNAFIPLDDEHRLVSIDYSQIEMRIFAHFAKEEEMLRRIRSGMNMHEAVAAVLYHLPDGTKADPRIYSIVKNANFANVYGAGVSKFAATAGIPEEEAKTFLADYHKMFPGVRRFQHEIDEIASSRVVKENRAYVRAPSGRLHVSDPDHIYKLVNYLIQGTAADVLKERLVQLDCAGFGGMMFLPIHDEVLFDFPAEAVGDLSASAAGIMRDTTSFSVPLDVSVSPPLERWEK
jgi:DNA polymerase-1